MKTQVLRPLHSFRLRLCSCCAPTVHAQPPTKSIWDGVYTDAQATRGKALYSESCASCHGGELTGGEMAPPLAGGEFMAGWDGLTIGDLFERVRISMPQNAPGSLSGAAERRHPVVHVQRQQVPGRPDGAAARKRAS